MPALKLTPKLSQLQRAEVVLGLSNAMLDALALTLRSNPKIEAEDCLPLLNEAISRTHGILMRASQIEQRHAEES